MNLLLLTEEDLLSDNQAIIKDRRLQHIQLIRQSQVGDTLEVGLINGKKGFAKIIALSYDKAILDFQLNNIAPTKLPVTLLLALPRPKMLRRILQTATTLGVSKIILINSYKVEKSFWQTPFLTPRAINQQLQLGLEQAKDTILPEVQLVKRFKPFVEDQLATLAKHTNKLIAHLGNYPTCPSLVTQPTTLAIGPEGGWIDYEVTKLIEIGFQPIQLGQRVLKVETAVVALLTKLFY